VVKEILNFTQVLLEIALEWILEILVALEDMEEWVALVGKEAQAKTKKTLLNFHDYLIFYIYFNFYFAAYL
jgi:hypothetical protein